MPVVKLIKCLIQSISDMINHDGIEHAGYLSFLFMLAIFPFLFFFMALIGTIGDENLGNKLVEMILASSWARFIDALKPRILEITASPPQSLLTIAVIGAVWTASSIFEALRTVLNRAYRITSTPAYILRRLLSIGEFFIAITITVLLVVILIIVPNVIYFYEKFVSSYIPFNLAALVTPEADKIRLIILMIVTLFLVSFAYYTLPNRKQKFFRTMPGAFIVIIGWYLFGLLFTIYVTSFPQVNLIYGSIASVIIALLYFYFCSIIFIIGAEFNYQLEITFITKDKK